MNFNSLLNQVLSAAQKNLPQTNQSISGINQDMLKTIGGGAAAAGLLAMLMGKKQSKGGSTLMRAGSMAALGALAYQAYQTWQRNQAGATPTPDAYQAQAANPEAASRIMLRTMIAAAVADGLVEDAERQLIQSEIQDEPEMQQWLAAEIQNPATVAELAHEIGNNPALAAEAYLAARMVCGDLMRKEIVFLSQLSQALNLDEKLVETLEQQAGFNA